MRTDTGPLRSPRALERNILKYRAIQITLILFYAEELKRDILDSVRAVDEWRNVHRDSKVERVPRGSKNELKKALDALENDKIINRNEINEIVDLIDYRNMIAHEIHTLTADITTSRFVRDLAKTMLETEKFNYEATVRFEHYINLLSERITIRTLTFNSSMFGTAEKTYKTELSRLAHRVVRQVEQRKRETALVNAEVRSIGAKFTDDLHPRHPFNRYDNGRLTKRGIELCYRLFDEGASTISVAHFLGLSFEAAKRGRKLGPLWAV